MLSLSTCHFPASSPCYPKIWDGGGQAHLVAVRAAEASIGKRPEGKARKEEEGHVKRRGWLDVSHGLESQESRAPGGVVVK